MKAGITARSDGINVFFIKNPPDSL